jgi:hypothetical protein
MMFSKRLFPDYWRHSKNLLKKKGANMRTLTGMTVVLGLSMVLASMSVHAAYAEDSVPKSPHNPQGDPDVERGWRESQEKHRRQSDDHDRSETDAGHRPCPDDGVCSDQSTYKNRPPEKDEDKDEGKDSDD